MTEQTEIAETEADTGEMRSKLIARLAVAGVLVALLLGVLAFFDYLATAPDDSEEKVFTKPVPVAPKKVITQPVTPAENLPEPPAAPVPERSEAPASIVPPVAEAPAPVAPVVRPEPLAENRPKSASTVASVGKPVAPATVTPVPVTPEASAPPTIVTPAQRTVTPLSEPAVAKPSARIVEARPAPTATPPVVSRLFSGFLLQAGVFSSIQRAEELHARLTLSGVPSTLETRVQVGPFKSRQEAEAAQAKLKELGVETILVPPKGKN